MSELEKMGRNLMDIALQYTHPNFEGMYPDWGAVCNIGEELVRMSEQPQLNENQQIVLSWLKIKHFDSYFKAAVSDLFFYVRHDDIEGFPNLNHRKLVEGYKQLSDKEFAQVLEVFSRWAQEREEE